MTSQGAAPRSSDKVREVPALPGQRQVGLGTGTGFHPRIFCNLQSKMKIWPNGRGFAKGVSRTVSPRYSLKMKRKNGRKQKKRKETEKNGKKWKETEETKEVEENERKRKDIKERTEKRRPTEKRENRSDTVPATLFAKSREWPQPGPPSGKLGEGPQPPALPGQRQAGSQGLVEGTTSRNRSWQK